MAAVASSYTAAKAPAAALAQSGLTASSNSALPSFSGLRASAPIRAAKKTSCARGCKCARHAVVVRAAAESSDASEQALFASVSQSVAAPAAPAANSGVLVPSILGAGIVGGAALALLSKSSAPAAPAAAAPVTFDGGYVPRAKRAAPAALATMAATFPNAMQEETFMHAVAEELRNLGFRRDNCIALVNTCRDELALRVPFRPFPDIFFGFPHVSIGETGEVGSLLRRGRGKPSNACGALIAIRGDICAGGPIVEDPATPITRAALQAITDDLEYLISQTVDPATADYAVITGVQIHSGNNLPGEPFQTERLCDYIAPNAMYVVINGEKHILHCEINQINAIKSVPAYKFAN
ncbi:unnamed protein product [Closterium sp. Yama58-4]|nr:unnamed protein product [Closterium sp. Yama58-4]